MSRGLAESGDPLALFPGTPNSMMQTFQSGEPGNETSDPGNEASDPGNEASDPGNEASDPGNGASDPGMCKT